MRVVIVGPGAIGCLFAGLLAESGKDVWLLDKDAERAKVISTQGIRIDDDKGSRAARIKASADPDAIGRAGLVILCVKSYDVGPAILRALPLVGTKTTVVPLENGGGNVEKIMEAVAADQVVCGITSQGSTSLGPGHVRHAGSGITMLAAFARAERRRAEAVAGVLTDSRIEALVSDDMQELIWSKLVVSSAINPLTALLDVPNGRLLKDPETREVMRKAAMEAAAVARSKNLQIKDEDAVERVEKVCRDTADNISSMLQDKRKGRRMEIDAITGTIVKEARAAGISVPVNEMLLARLGETEKTTGMEREKT